MMSLLAGSPVELHDVINGPAPIVQPIAESIYGGQHLNRN